MAKRKGKEVKVTLTKVLNDICEEYNYDIDLIRETFKKAILSAYIADQDLNKEAEDVVRIVEDEDNELHLYHDFVVVDRDDYIDNLEITLADAKLIDSNIKLGDVLSKEINIADLELSTITKIKNNLKVKFREIDKQTIYDKFKDLEGEIVEGYVEKVVKSNVYININNTLAILPKSKLNPKDNYNEGSKLKVLISEVKKESKGSQIVVSRNDVSFVRRLLEKEVPEIYQGVVEIKAIARDAGDRSKVAVFSNNPDVDPIGACIGQRSQRIKHILSELKGEKIDLFKWSEDIVELIKNAISPSKMLACFFSDDNHFHITIVVEDSQLSLAIGKKGQNVKLASKLLSRKIDIKSVSEMLEQNIDYMGLYEELKTYEANRLSELKKEMDEKTIAEYEKRKEENAALEEDYVAEVFEDEEYQNYLVSDESNTDLAIKEEEITKTDNSDDEESSSSLETIVNKKEGEVEKKPIKTSASQKDVVKKDEYVSKFEEIAAKSNRSMKEEKKKKKKRKDDDDRKLKASELLKDKEYEMKIEYSQEELDEIAQKEYEDAYGRYEEEIDYDEFDSFYDED